MSSQLINGTSACSAKATCAASAIPKPELTQSSALDRVSAILTCICSPHSFKTICNSTRSIVSEIASISLMWTD
jgi:hypothetical protein